MCLRVACKEKDKKKQIVVWKVFRKTNRWNDDEKPGLWPQFKRTKTPAPTGKWLKSTRVGWHAHMTRKSALSDKGANSVIRKVRLRKIVGYGDVINVYRVNTYVGERYTKVRALEMFIL